MLRKWSRSVRNLEEVPEYQDGMLIICLLAFVDRSEYVFVVSIHCPVFNDISQICISILAHKNGQLCPEP